jgi:hypothetical protein
MSKKLQVASSIGFDDSDGINLLGENVPDCHGAAPPWVTSCRLALNLILYKIFCLLACLLP